ncbi:MAG TPA: PKD domain-containing protein [Candidatus Saccharimonadales bacterium]|nr:PKD domain-containing protein [Candidatus Saccharimonadales bacterium]
MKRLFLFLVTVYLLLTLTHKSVFAHVGGGPAFLEVNGVYAQTNPYFFNDPHINIPQDYTGKTYLVNKPIEVFIDLNQLLVPPDIATKSTFRWTFTEESTEYSFGVKQTHVYKKPGSYLLTLDVKAPGETQYTTIDTVQIDVLPNERYHMPKATMSIATNHRQSTKPLLFQSDFSVDTSTKVKEIIWGFGDGSIAKEKNALHTYINLQDYSTFPVIFRITDANGFKSYAGVIVESVKGQLHFVDNLGRENTIPVSDTMTNLKHSKNENNKNILSTISLSLGGIFFIIIILVIIVLKKKEKHSKN